MALEFLSPSTASCSIVISFISIIKVLVKCVRPPQFVLTSKRYKSSTPKQLVRVSHLILPKIQMNNSHFSMSYFKLKHIFGAVMNVGATMCVANYEAPYMSQKWLKSCNSEQNLTSYPPTIESSGFPCWSCWENTISACTFSYSKFEFEVAVRIKGTDEFCRTIRSA